MVRTVVMVVFVRVLAGVSVAVVLREVVVN